MRALVVEDDAGTADFLRLGLRYEGYEVAVCTDGARALRTAQRLRPDVVVLDWMLPGPAGLDGVAVCRRLRASAALREAAVVILTAKDALEDRVAGLDAGADDYVVKPFRFEELAARIRAVRRRRAVGPGLDGATLAFADVTLNPETRRVERGGVTVRLTPREFGVLHALMEQARRVFSKSQLLERVWGYDYDGDDNIVELYVGYLRDKLGDRPPRLLRTERGVGYVLREPGEP